MPQACLPPEQPWEHMSSAPSLTGPALGPCRVCLPSPRPLTPSSPEAPFTQPPFLVGCFDHRASCLLASKCVPGSTPTACRATGELLGTGEGWEGQGLVFRVVTTSVGRNYGFPFPRPPSPSQLFLGSRVI